MDSESASTELRVEVMVTRLCSATAKLKLLVVKNESETGRYRLLELPQRVASSGNPRDAFPEIFAADETIEDQWVVSRSEQASRVYVSKKMRFLNSSPIVRDHNHLTVTQESFETPKMRLAILATSYSLYSLWDSWLVAIAVPIGTVLLAKAYQRFSMTRGSLTGDTNKTDWVWKDLDDILNKGDELGCSPELVAMAQKHYAELSAPYAHMFKIKWN